MRKYDMFVNGQWVSAASGRTFCSINPTTQEPVAEVPEADKQDVDAAVNAAKAAHESGVWRHMAPMEREAILHRVGEQILERAAELNQLIAEEMGKPLVEAPWETTYGAQLIHYDAGLPSRLSGVTFPTAFGEFSYTVREPVGVVAAITPWNFPLFCGLQKISPAIACGNCVVWKPAEETPAIALEVARMYQDAGLPDGVLNVVTGNGEKTGAPLANHSDIDKIAFTGSTEVGQILMGVAAKGLKRISLELGGKSPNVVLADADMDLAVQHAANGVYGNCGQVCAAVTRLFLEDSIHDQFLEKLIGKSKQISLGDPLNSATTMGPIVTKTQQEKVLNYIETGEEEGARLAYCGDLPNDPALSHGNFVPPAIFEGVTNKMRIAREEIFGPVLSVIRFRDPQDAVRQANDSPYGLAASIWTQDITKAQAITAELRAGTIWINGYGSGSVFTPWGGFKQSGIGRERGIYSIDSYTELKCVHYRLERAGQYVPLGK